MVFIGIDPGVSGGIAWLDEDGNVVRTVKMPETDRDILTELGAWLPARAVIERVQAYSAPGRAMGAKSAFTFGGGFRALKMALTACDIPYEEITPQSWQKFMSCRTKGDKNISKAKAQQLFPSVKKITHANADALLIAEFCRRRHLQHPAEPASTQFVKPIEDDF